MLVASKHMTIDLPGGVVVHVESVRGGGRTLVAITPVGAEWLLHALPVALADRFTIHIAELPGTGRSTSDGGPPTVKGLVDSIGAVVDALGVDCFLFGHSLNGLLAIAAAERCKATGVIAVGAPPAIPHDMAASKEYFDAKAEPERRLRLEEVGAKLDAADTDEDRLPLVVEYDRLRRWCDMAFDPTHLDEVSVRTPGWVQAVFESAKDIAWPDITASVRAPVLLMLGEYDFLVPPALWQPDALPPRATVEVFGRSGHTPFFEQPEEFIQTVDGWLTSLS